MLHYFIIKTIQWIITVTVSYHFLWVSERSCNKKKIQCKWERCSSLLFRPLELFWVFFLLHTLHTLKIIRRWFGFVIDNVFLIHACNNWCKLKTDDTTEIVFFSSTLHINGIQHFRVFFLARFFSINRIFAQMKITALIEEKSPQIHPFIFHIVIFFSVLHGQFHLR